MSALYDRIGTTYAATRRAEPRWAARIERALGDARTVLNVGAGTGAYEPGDREVLAVEPSAVMRAQRAPTAAPAVPGAAEALPFADGSFDATMAVLSDHHWADRARGLREMRRVARLRAVVVQWDAAFADAFWLAAEYLPSFRALAAPFSVVPEALGATAVEALPVPHDCADGHFMAFWRRPEAYLDPLVRANVSVFHGLPPAEVEAAVSALRADLASGAWAARHADLLECEELDLGYRLVVAEET